MKYYGEFCGGLGDIIMRCYQERYYMRLANLAEEDNAAVVFWSQNPYAQEIFEWCPARARLSLVTKPYLNVNDPATRNSVGLPDSYAMMDIPHWPDERVQWHPDPKEVVLTALLLASKKSFILVSASAGVPDRTLPAHLVDQLCRAVAARGITVVAVGRNYIAHNPRNEVVPPVIWGVINLIDRLCVPGVLRLVQKAAGCIVCESAVLHASWGERKPTLFLYNQRCEELQIKPMGGYAYGAAYPTTVHCRMEQFSAEHLDRFLKLAEL